MSEWRCYHLDETLAAMAISDGGRFLVRLREPAGESRHPIEFHRGTLKEATRAADGLVQAYYPHDCRERGCGAWHKL